MREASDCSAWPPLRGLPDAYWPRCRLSHGERFGTARAEEATTRGAQEHDASHLAVGRILESARHLIAAGEPAAAYEFLRDAMRAAVGRGYRHGPLPLHGRASPHRRRPSGAGGGDAGAAGRGAAGAWTGCGWIVRRSCSPSGVTTRLMRSSGIFVAARAFLGRHGVVWNNTSNASAPDSAGSSISTWASGGMTM